MKNRKLIWLLPLLASLVIAIMCLIEILSVGSVPRITNAAIISKIADSNLVNFRHSFSFLILWEIPVAFVFTLLLMLFIKLVAHWKVKINDVGENSANVVNSAILGVIVGVIFSLSLSLGSSLENGVIIGVLSLLVFGSSLGFLISESKPSPQHLLLVFLSFCIFLSLSSSLAIGFALDSITLGFMVGLAISFVSILLIFSAVLILKIIKALILTPRFLGQMITFNHLLKRDD